MTELRTGICPQCGKFHSALEDCRDYVLAPDPYATRPPEVDIAFEKLSDAGKLIKIRYHLGLPGGYPIPAPWVQWLMTKILGLR